MIQGGTGGGARDHRRTGDQHLGSALHFKQEYRRPRVREVFSYVRLSCDQLWIVATAQTAHPRQQLNHDIPEWRVSQVLAHVYQSRWR